MNIKYCLRCERYVLVSQGYLGDVHMGTYQNPLEPPEFDWCDGPFVMSEPPIMSDEEWELTFRNEPDADELVQIDANNEHLVEW